MAGRKPMLPAMSEARPVIHCAWDGCFQRSVTYEEIEPGKGRHNLCEYHYVEAHHARAKRWCEERGLVTVDQKRACCKALSKTIIKPMPGREPGQD